MTDAAVAVDLRAAEQWFDYVYGELEGKACLAVGTPGTDTWRQQFYAWPAQRRAMVEEAIRLAPTRDVYAGVVLHSSRDCGADSGLPGPVVWIDHDNDNDGEAAQFIRDHHGVVVSSGSGASRFHGYLRLNAEVTIDELEDLNRALAAKLGGDSKWSASTVLRVPGTLHHKQTPPRPVRWHTPPDGFPGWAPDDLRALLGPAPRVAAPELATVEPVEPDRIPPYVRRRMNEQPNGDRSGQVANLVRNCVEAGLSDGETMWIARQHPPATAKYGNRLGVEVARLIGKHRPLHQHPGKPCDVAGCLNKPSWMKGPEVVDRSLRAQLLSNDDLASLPPPEPLVGDVLMRNTLAVLFGPPGSAKSFVAQDWAMSIASGLAWHGHPIHTGAALYIAGEGTSGINQRRLAWQKARKEQGERMSWLPVAVDLRDPTQVKDLCGIVADLRPQLVVVDTLARCLPGADENSAQDLGRAIASADRVRVSAGGACVLFVHHSTKDGLQLRGSSALAGAADTIIEASKQGLGVLLRCRKQKDGAEFRPIGLRMVASDQSIVLQADDERTVEAVPASDLAVFAEHFGHGVATKAEVRDVFMEAGCSKATAYRKIDQLAGNEWVENIGAGPAPRFRLSDAGREQLANEDGRLL